MNQNHVTLFLLLLSLTIILTGCASLPDTPPLQTEQSPLETTTQDVDGEAVILTPEVSPEVSTTQEEMEAAETETVSPEPTAAISHQTQPGEPIYTQSISSECNTGYNYNATSYQVQPPCDSWNINLLERAVSADLSQFYPYLDILSAHAGLSTGWLYFSIDLFGAGVPTDGVDFTYFVEIDIDQNGRGDVLVSVTNLDLDAMDWNTSGVRAFQDLSGDVGGLTAVWADDLPGADGYETMVFDEGIGEDPDMVWARRNPDLTNQIELAIKLVLLDNDINFMWWAGAMRGSFTPQAFDFVDSQDSASYFEIDTTCGLVYGREEAYNIKKCYVAPIPTPTVQIQHSSADPTQEATPEPTEDICVQPPHPDPQNNCWVWFPEECKWVCFN